MRAEAFYLLDIGAEGLEEPLPACFQLGFVSGY
jgi:hypothetical protein